MYDVIIIGSGPAGISAAIYLKRAKKNILIVSNGKSALQKAHKIENYYGIESISGSELYNTGIKQAERLGIPIDEDEVTNISYENNFIVYSIVPTMTKSFQHRLAFLPGYLYY